MELLDSLKWRYATKKFDPTKKVAKEQIEKLLEVANLAPSSSGLQPFCVIVISNQELKEKLVIHSHNQQQVADGSHLFVFAAWDNYTVDRIDTIFDHITKERDLTDNKLDSYRDNLKKLFLSQEAEKNFEHIARQVYISVGMVIAAAAELRIDATPMEGFDENAYDEILNLKEKGLRSVLVMPIGYRDENNDWLINMKKVRQPKENFVIEIK